MKGRYVGSSDVPVCDKGMDQVRKTARLLRAASINKIYCSPMLRCRQTLDLLEMPEVGDFNDLLKEVDFGRWEGKQFEEILQSDEELVQSWVTAPDTFTFPGGEPVSGFRNRVTAFASQLDMESDEGVLVVAHGGVIRHLLCTLLNLTPDKYLAFDVQPGCYCSMRLYPEGGVLTGFNIKG
jgi:alpha-ribazole phosphatase